MRNLLITTAVVASMAFTAVPASAWTLSGITNAVTNKVSSLWSSVTGGNKTYYGQPIDWRYATPAPGGALSPIMKTVNGKRTIVGYSYAVSGGTGSRTGNYTTSDGATYQSGPPAKMDDAELARLHNIASDNFYELPF